MQGDVPNLDQTTSGNQNRAVLPRQSEKCQEARNLIQVFIKTIKSYRIYALNNPILTRFVDQLHQRVHPHFPADIRL